MFYLRIGPKKARLIFIALLILVAVALLFCTSEKGVIKSCYDDADERRNFIRVHGFETAEDYTVKTVQFLLSGAMFMKITINSKKVKGMISAYSRE